MDPVSGSACFLSSVFRCLFPNGFIRVLLSFNPRMLREQHLDDPRHLDRSLKTWDLICILRFSVNFSSRYSFWPTEQNIDEYLIKRKVADELQNLLFSSYCFYNSLISQTLTYFILCVQHCIRELGYKSEYEYTWSLPS